MSHWCVLGWNMGLKFCCIHPSIHPRIFHRASTRSQWLLCNNKQTKMATIKIIITMILLTHSQQPNITENADKLSSLHVMLTANGPVDLQSMWPDPEDKSLVNSSAAWVPSLLLTAIFPVITINLIPSLISCFHHNWLGYSWPHLELHIRAMRTGVSLTLKGLAGGWYKVQLGLDVA